MDFQFNEEQQELRTIARAFLAEHGGSEAVRAAMESELGYDPALWKQISAELGWTSVHIPEAYGGLGLGYVELVALMEVMGEALLCSPFLATIGLGANAILAAGSELQKERLLPELAEGTRTATLALCEESGSWAIEDVTCVARPGGDGFALTGRKHQVLDGHSADLLLVVARLPDTAGREGIGLFAVPGEHPGVSRRALPTVDQTRRLAVVELEDVRVAADARLGEEGGAATADALDRALQRAAVALAAEQVGGAQRCLDMAVAYAKEREQFGRPIGSFQAIKHKCADMMTAVETARSAAYYAACVASLGDDSDELASVASLAKAWCSDAFFRCAADCIQIHGGVGFTWEYDCHLYFKRARASEHFLGDPALHRERVAAQLLDR